MTTAFTEENGIRVSVDAVGDAAWALGRSLYEPIELVAAVRRVDDEPGETWFEETREVKTMLVARLITMGPHPVRSLTKLARQSGFTRDRGCPHDPEIIPLYNGWPDGPITASLDAYVTTDRQAAVLTAEPNSPEDRSARASRSGMELIAELLAWPTTAAAAQLIEAYAPANPQFGG